MFQPCRSVTLVLHSLLPHHFLLCKQREKSRQLACSVRASISALCDCSLFTNASRCDTGRGPVQSSRDRRSVTTFPTSLTQGLHFGLRTGAKQVLVVVEDCLINYLRVEGVMDLAVGGLCAVHPRRPFGVSLTISKPFPDLR